MNFTAHLKKDRGPVRRRFVAGVVAMAVVASAGIASADIISNAIDASVDNDVETMALTVGGAAGSTQLRVIPTDGDGKSGCNLTGSTTLVADVASSNTAVATVWPPSVTFDSCGAVRTISVTAVAEGSATISLTQTSNDSQGTFDLRPATFAATVGQATPSKSDQTIMFTAPGSPAEYGSTFTVSPTSSGGTVTMTASGSCSAAAATGGGYTITMTAGTGNCTLTASQAGSDTHNAATDVVRTVAAAPRAITGSFTATNKVYDGTTSAPITNPSLTGAIAGDAVSLSGGTAAFATSSVGTGKTVTGSGFSLSGTAAGNYTLQSVGDATADITAKSVTGSFTAANKVYDGTTSASITNPSLTGAIAGDAVSLSGGTAAFATSSVGTGKTVTGSGFSLSGTAAGNYTLQSVGDATADITAKSVTGSFTAANKVYDGTTSATITNPSLTGAIAGDAVSLSGGTAAFATSSVGTGKTVTGSGFSLSGTAAGNYTLASVSDATADITAWNALNYGFYQPVGVGNSVFVASGSAASHPSSNAQTVWNTVKGGSTVPLKFNVFAGDTEKVNTSDVSSFSAAKVSGCTATTATEPVEEVASGSTNLRYDSVDKQFIQNWKTPSVTTNTCYRATIVLADGSTVSAFFLVRK